MRPIARDAERMHEETVATERPHEHAWEVESAHSTSLGRVLYVRCAECGTRRVDLQGHPHTPPSALSTNVPSAGASDTDAPGAEVAAPSVGGK